MPRVFVTDDSVKPLLVRLARLFLVERNVLAVSRRLSVALAAAGEEGRLYPNRLATLLSDDSTKTVNDQTVATLRRALELVPIDGPAQPDEEKLKSAILGQWSRTP